MNKKYFYAKQKKNFLSFPKLSTNREKSAVSRSIQIVYLLLLKKHSKKN